MNEDEKTEALENIRYIKELITRTKEEMINFGYGWISILWGVFCIVGFAGQWLFIPPNAWRGAWWLVLSLITGFATFRIVKSFTRKQPQKTIKYIIRKFLVFWIPLMVLGYTLTLFCAFHPSLSPQYIPVVIMLVVSTGYLIIGLLFQKEVFIMGLIGYIGTLIIAIYFLEYADILVSSLFGIGLIITGIVMNLRIRKQ